MTTPADDHFDLDRFVRAQDAGGAYERAHEELGRGRKTSHWMWFVFPQIAGLGLSATSQHFAISDTDEAKAYLGHPTLGPRLLDCVDLLLALPAGTTAEDVFGQLDALKLRSSMTLFAHADPTGGFRLVLERFFGGEEDEMTLSRM